jgi:mannosyltransferase
VLDGALKVEVPAAEADAPTRNRRSQPAWVWPSLLVLVLGGWDLTRPALWADEMATWGVTRVSWGQLWHLSGQLDGAITPYYAVMKVWTAVFGYSELALRLPSVLGMSVAAGLIVQLGDRLHSTRSGVLAGLVFAVLPSTSRYAQEARAYGLLLPLVILATLLLVRALDAPTRSRFAAYGVVLALVGLAQLLGVLVLGGHALYLWLRRRDELRRWLVTVGLAGLPSVPFAVLVVREHSRLSWIPEPTWGAATSVGELFGAAAVGALVIGMALLSRPRPAPGLLLAGWAVLPYVALLVASAVKSVFWYRYLMFTVPAYALLAGVALARLRWWRCALVLAVLAALGSLEQQAMRLPDGHGYGTRDAAAIIAAGERPGDAVAYASPEAYVSWISRDLVAYYVPPGKRPRDVFAVREQRVSGQLLASECPDLAACLGEPAPPRMWVVRYGAPADPLAGIGPVKERLLRSRYTVLDVRYARNLTVALLVRR